MNNEKEWKTYEEVATYLLGVFKDVLGFQTVEEKQKIPGNKSGTTYEIDAKGVLAGNGGFFIVECRRYTRSKQSQEKMGALAYRILDCGASGGIVVSPLGFQLGASKIAEAENIFDVRLTPESTPESFAMSFLNKFKTVAGTSLGITGKAPDAG